MTLLPSERTVAPPAPFLCSWCWSLVPSPYGFLLSLCPGGWALPPRVPYPIPSHPPGCGMGGLTLALGAGSGAEEPHQGAARCSEKVWKSRVMIAKLFRHLFLQQVSVCPPGVPWGKGRGLSCSTHFQTCALRGGRWETAPPGLHRGEMWARASCPSPSVSPLLWPHKCRWCCPVSGGLFHWQSGPLLWPASASPHWSLLSLSPSLLPIYVLASGVSKSGVRASLGQKKKTHTQKAKR